MRLRVTAALAATLLNLSVNAEVHLPIDLPEGIYIGDLSPTPNFSLMADIPVNTTTTLVSRTEEDDRLGPPDYNHDTVCGDYQMNTKDFAITARRMTIIAEYLSKSQRLLEYNTIITLKMGTTVVYICVGEQTEPILQSGPSKYKEWTYGKAWIDWVFTCYVKLCSLDMLSSHLCPEHTQNYYYERYTNLEAAWNNMDGFCGNEPIYGSKAAHFTYHGYKRVWGRANSGQKICEGVMNKNFMKWDEKTDAPWKKPLPGVDWRVSLGPNLA